MQDLPVLEVRGLRVLTSAQIAEAYGVKSDIIGYNFRYNKARYEEGKHYIMLEGQDLREFKLTNVEIQRSLPRINKLYLWTEKGALLHAKSLNTDKAWEVYDYLVDFYFRVKEHPVMKQDSQNQVQEKKVVNVPENQEILNAIKKVEDDLTCMRVLLDNCKKYISEEEYKERSRNVNKVLNILINDLTMFISLQPKMVEVKY